MSTAKIISAFTASLLFLTSVGTATIPMHGAVMTSFAEDSKQEIVTMYRYREKVYIQSTEKLGEPYVYVREQTDYSDYGGWSEWTKNAVSGSDTREVAKDDRQIPVSYEMVSYRTRGNPNTIDPDCYRVNTSSGTLTVRSEPNASSTPVGQAQKGNIFIVDAYEGNWVHTPSVHTTSGAVVSGWLSKTYLAASGIYNVQYRNYSVNGDFAGYDLSTSFGEHSEGSPWTWDAGTLNSARQVAPWSFVTGLTVHDGTHNADGYNMTDQTGYVYDDGYASFIWFINKTNYSNETWYRYRDRTKTTTYQYYKWSDWTEWSTEQPVVSDDIVIEKKEVSKPEPTVPPGEDIVIASDFDFNKDVWNFLNTEKYFGEPQINDSYWNTMLTKLSPTDKVSVMELKRKLSSQRFSGVCYGMSSLVSLYKQGYLSPGYYTPNAKTLKQISNPNDDDVESLIVYYFLLQETSAARQAFKMCTMKSSKSYTLKPLMNNIIQRVADIAEGKSAPLVINYGWIEGNNKGWAHSVIAYGVEYGKWDIAPEYDGRLLIYDCNKGSFKDDACIYFKKDTMEWCVPYKGLEFVADAPNCYARIIFADNDPDILNNCGVLKSDTVSVDSTSDSEWFPEISINNSNISIRKTGENDTFAINSTEMEDDEIFSCFGSISGDADSDINFFMTDKTSGYSAFSNVDEEMNVSMRFSDEIAKIQANNSHKVTFLPNGTVSLSGVKTDYSIDIITDYSVGNFPWYEVTVDGFTDSDLTMYQYENGYILSGKLAKQLKLSAKNNNNGQMVQSEDLSGHSKVYVTTDKDGFLEILVDKDKDGRFETSINKLIRGDVNCDGRVDVYDFILLRKWYLDKDIVVNTKAVDFDGSGELNIADLVSIQKFLLNAKE